MNGCQSFCLSDCLLGISCKSVFGVGNSASYTFGVFLDYLVIFVDGVFKDIMDGLWTLVVLGVWALFSSEAIWVL